MTSSEPTSEASIAIPGSGREGGGGPMTAATGDVPVSRAISWLAHRGGLRHRVRRVQLAGAAGGSNWATDWFDAVLATEHADAPPPVDRRGGRPPSRG